ncbi:hypothetical protein HanIR_Chr11g0517271 [Helianthus annuus]|nr:hypothetical protein HanIR_Chr11g0517271 [Helianthus annuus]
MLKVVFVFLEKVFRTSYVCAAQTVRRPLGLKTVCFLEDLSSKKVCETTSWCRHGPMSSWVCRPLLLHKTLAPLHPFSSTHRPLPPLPPPPLHLRRPTPADAHLQPTPTLLHHSSFSPLLLHHLPSTTQVAAAASTARHLHRDLHQPSPPSRSPQQRHLHSRCLIHQNHFPDIRHVHKNSNPIARYLNQKLVFLQHNIHSLKSHVRFAPLC